MIMMITNTLNEQNKLCNELLRSGQHDANICDLADIIGQSVNRVKLLKYTQWVKSDTKKKLRTVVKGERTR